MGKSAGKTATCSAKSKWMHNRQGLVFYPQRWTATYGTKHQAYGGEFKETYNSHKS
jgi:hypothetical protein